MKEALNELVLLDEDELFGMLGKATGPKDFGLNDMQAYVRLGRAWFQQNTRQLEDRICSSNGVRVFVDGGAEHNAVVEAAAVADAVAGMLDQETIYLFAVLVTRLGLTAYCSSHA
jgi:hypothetical protein